MTAPTILDPVVAYAAAVRAHLADLGPELLEDLTGGLEADLAESLADAFGPTTPTDVDLTSRFGSPQAYAAELRESAGLPPAGSTVRRPRLAARVAARWTARVERWGRALDRTRAWPPVRDVLRALVPVWWVLRGWALAAVASVPLMALLGGVVQVVPPRTFVAWLLTLAGVVVSVQVGRGLWVPRGRWSLAWQVLAVVLVPVAFGITVATASKFDDGRPGGQGVDVWSAVEARLAQIPAWRAFGEHDTGVMIDGRRATNLFVYGPDGELIEGAQIVDQSGSPLVLGVGGAGVTAPDGQSLYVPRVDEAGRPVLNAFPLPVWAVPDWEVEHDENGLPVVPEGAVEVPRPPARTLVPLAPAAAAGDEPGSTPGTPADDDAPAADDAGPDDGTGDAPDDGTGDATDDGTGDATDDPTGDESADADADAAKGGAEKVGAVTTDAEKGGAQKAEAETAEAETAGTE